MFTVYILYSTRLSRFYAGQTDDIDLRLLRHNSGIVKSTKRGVPWKVIWTSVVISRTDSLRLERKIKKRGISRFLDDEGFDWKNKIS